MKKLFVSTLFLATTTLSHTGFAASMPGEALVNQSCQQCHDNGIFSRKNSILRSYPELQARVEFCESNSKAHWNETQINQVIEYLNETYYKFPKP